MWPDLIKNHVIPVKKCNVYSKSHGWNNKKNGEPVIGTEQGCSNVFVPCHLVVNN